MSTFVLERFERWRNRILLIALVVIVLIVVWFRANFELVSVPKAMDTLPITHPPGATCIVLKRPSKVAVGDVVFVDLPAGGTLLARVAEVTEAGIVVAGTNQSSVFTGGKPIGPLAPGAVRGRVITVFGGGPDPDARIPK